MRNIIQSWKLPLACAGIVVIVATHGVFLALPSALPTSSFSDISTGSASRKATFSAGGFLGLGGIDIHVSENWVWDMPTEVRHLNDVVLRLSCSVQFDMSDLPARFHDIAIAEYSGTASSDPVVSVSGDVEFHTPVSVNKSGNCADTLEFSWHFTATQRGRKKINVVLPPLTRYSDLQRIVSYGGPSKPSLSADFFADAFQIPLYVEGPFGLSTEAELFFKLLGSFVGVLLISPLLSTFFKQRV